MNIITFIKEKTAKDMRERVIALDQHQPALNGHKSKGQNGGAILSLILFLILIFLIIITG